jgi:hypothetical protein
MSMSRCILLNHAHIGDQHIPSFVDSIRLLLQDYEHVTLHTPRSCPHWRSTHPFLRLFDSLDTTRLWACHVTYSSTCPHWRSTHSFLRRFDSLSTTRLWASQVTYSSIMPTLEISTSHPLLIQFAYYYKIISMSRCILLGHAHIGDQHIPSFIDLIRLILHDYEHVTLHIPWSHPLWRSTNLPSFVDSIRLVL